MMSESRKCHVVDLACIMLRSVRASAVTPAKQLSNLHRGGTGCTAAEYPAALERCVQDMGIRMDMNGIGKTQERVQDAAGDVAGQGHFGAWNESASWSSGKAKENKATSGRTKLMRL